MSLYLIVSLVLNLLLIIYYIALRDNYKTLKLDNFEQMKKKVHSHCMVRINVLRFYDLFKDNETLFNDKELCSIVRKNCINFQESGEKIHVFSVDDFINTLSKKESSLK